MKKMLLVVMMIWSTTGCQSGSGQQPSLKYDVYFPKAEHNEARVTLTMANLLPGQVTLSMSRSSPGRYALHEFSKNVYNVIAINGQGDTLSIERPDLHHWEIEGHDGTLKFHYTLFGDHADGTYSGINRQHAHLNMPASFIWAPNLPNTPISISFHPPEGSNWKVATQLKPTDKEMTFTAPNTYYFLDSPVELSNFETVEWKVSADTTNQTIRLALHHNGTQQQMDDYAAMAQKVVAEQVAVFGELPVFDYGTYTFITDYLPYVYGDGMEHRNSTILTSRRSLEEGALQNLGTLSHEFFHVWNVERIRPRSLEPFNFMRANVSGALWFAEGFTSYYDDLTIRRAGLTSNKKYAAGWSGTLNYVLNSPGNSYYNPIEMSRQAPFVDAATSVDAQNKSNTFISYYSWGATIALGLDLTLRSTFDEITLDDFMHRMWTKYGKTEKPYKIADLQSTLAEVTDSTEFARRFFNRHIYNGHHVNLKPLLAKAGFSLQRADSSQPVLSFGAAKISYENGKAVVAQRTQVGSPLYNAGLDKGDEIISVDGQSIKNAKEMQQLIQKHKAGDQLVIKYRSLDVERENLIRLVKSPVLKLIPYEDIDKKLTPVMQQFRRQWLESKVKK